MAEEQRLGSHGSLAWLIVLFNHSSVIANGVTEGVGQLNKAKVRKGKNKDISARELEQFSDVYADILNVLLFDGKQEIRPEELAD